MLNARIILAGVLAVLAFAPATVTAETEKASEIIDFTLPSLSGDSVALSDLRGQWVLVNYWATWCAPCRKEIPDFSAMHDARDDITVLGLAFEDTDIATFEEFLIDYPASYPILLVDVYEPPGDLGAPKALPTSFLVDPDGRIAETWIGPLTSQTIMGRIDNGPSE